MKVFVRTVTLDFFLIIITLAKAAASSQQAMLSFSSVLSCFLRHCSVLLYAFCVLMEWMSSFLLKNSGWGELLWRSVRVLALRESHLWSSLPSFKVIFLALNNAQLCRNKGYLCITVFTVAMWTVCVLFPFWLSEIVTSLPPKSGPSFTRERWQYFT